MALLLLWPLKQLLEIQDKHEILPSAEELPKNQQLHVKIYIYLMRFCSMGARFFCKQYCT